MNIRWDFGSRTVQLTFEDMKVPAENLLGEEGQGFKVAMANLDVGRIGIGAQALGIAEAALGCAIDYAKEREQFGKLRRSKGLASSLQIWQQVSRARLLVYRAASLRAQGLPCGKEASIAKLFASKTAVEVAIEAVQVFGGYGYTKDYPVERFFRDAKITQIYEGTSEIQKLVISRAL